MKKVRGQKAERTREAKRALLHSALDIIGESGLAGLTLAQVGIRAGYSRGLVQYHYGSKEALISALVGWAVRGGQQMLRDNMTRGVDSVLLAIDAYNLTRRIPQEFTGFLGVECGDGLFDQPGLSPSDSRIPEIPAQVLCRGLRGRRHFTRQGGTNSNNYIGGYARIDSGMDRRG